MKDIEIIDISIPISNEMLTYPGDPKPEIKQVFKISEGNPYNLSSISFSSHAGTHVDAPRHFVKDAKTIDELPLDHFIGETEVLDLTHVEKEITAGDLEKLQSRFPKSGILLFKTKNSHLLEKERFQKDYVYIDVDAAEYLVKKGIKTLGIDFLSIGKPGLKGAQVHRTLLRNGVIIIEGLFLRDAKPGRYTLVCLPLKILRGDGAPARAVLIKGL